jgi:diguanylate cyclase (GGDEF)-like protein
MGGGARTLQNTYGGYSYTLRDLVHAQAYGDRKQMESDADQARLSASALRKQASVNIARNNLASAALLAQAQRANHRLLVAVSIISGIDLIVVLFCAFVLVAYQRNTERQARESRHRAAHDGLTGVANRSLLTEKLDEAIEDGRAGLLLLDLNRFKEVNDTLGHHAGDLLIQEVARRLVASARHYDTVARLGGDEFAIVLPDVTSTDDLLRLGRRILTALCLPAEIGGVTVDVSASIGASLFPIQSANAAELLQHADVAMYAAKRGHLGVALYDAQSDENSFEKLAVVGDLRRAIDNDELELHYQPKVRVSDRTVCGVEALVRWRHPVRGLVFPDQFIPVAEQNGLIRPLTDVVLRLALAQQRTWRAGGRRIPVAVNVGADCLLDPVFTDRLRELMAGYGTWPEDLTDESVMTALGEIGCESAQGYYMCRPQPADVVLAWIAAAPVEVLA